MLIEKREIAENVRLIANIRAGHHPRNLAELIGQECESSAPIAERVAKGSIPFAVNRGAGIPNEEED